MISLKIALRYKRQIPKAPILDLIASWRNKFQFSNINNKNLWQTGARVGWQLNRRTILFVPPLQIFNQHHFHAILMPHKIDLIHQH